MSTVALPSLNNALKQKTWSHNVNNTKAFTTANEGKSALLFRLKQGLLSMSGAAVRGSSDGTTAAMDGVDRVTSDPANLTVGLPLRWVVIELANMSGGLEVCIAWHSTAGIRVMFSGIAGFTGGTTSVRPTATDEFSGGALDAFVTSGTLYTHFLYSSDGKSFHFFATGDNKIHSYCACIEGVMASELSNSIDTLMTIGNINSAVYSQNTHTSHSRAIVSSALTNLTLSTGPFAGASGNARGNNGGRFIANEFGYHTSTESNDGIIFQRMIDIYSVAGGVGVTGDTAPTPAGAREWMQIGELMIPWNGTPLTLV